MNRSNLYKIEFNFDKVSYKEFSRFLNSRPLDFRQNCWTDDKKRLGFLLMKYKFINRLDKEFQDWFWNNMEGSVVTGKSFFMDFMEN